MTEPAIDIDGVSINQNEFCDEGKNPVYIWVNLPTKGRFVLNHVMYDLENVNWDRVKKYSQGHSYGHINAGKYDHFLYNKNDFVKVGN